MRKDELPIVHKFADRQTVEALKEVRQEIQKLHDLYKINVQGYSMSVAGECLEIIDKKIKEYEDEK